MNLFRKKDISLILADADAHTHGHGSGLTRSLGLKDLTALGIAAIIGAGIFSTIGNASSAGGPAVSLLFVFTAVACAFSAMCYAQFASTIPLSGSAYTYAYASFGELVAWIIGWDLLMEYAIGNIAVAISWSDYFTQMLRGFGLHLPEFITMDFLTASRGYQAVEAMQRSGTALADIPQLQVQAHAAWQHAPRLFGVPMIADLPALMIVVLITYLVYVGISESKKTANLLVLLKLIVILMVIGVGAFYVSPGNWTPFAPNGVSGVLKGISAVFFAYIGFDAISTTAEECKNPQRDLPKAMMLALLICTILYVAISLVLTGMVPYTELAVGDPLAFVFGRVGLNFMAGVVAVSAIVAIASVLLVFQLGQPRIWMSMSRDGLLPPLFSSIHPKYKTPWFATIIAGFVVAVPALFMNLTEVTDLTSIGTLFAFVLVCGGILLLDHKNRTEGISPEQAKAQGDRRVFRVPYINGQVWVPVLLAATGAMLLVFNLDGISAFVDFSGGWETLRHKLPLLGFLAICLWIGFWSITRKLSLIPVLGLLTNLYLMTELGITNWARFLLWLAIGLVIYFSYGIRNSKLNKQA